jgi:hypothetical protein
MVTGCLTSAGEAAAQCVSPACLPGAPAGGAGRAQPAGAAAGLPRAGGRRLPAAHTLHHQVCCRQAPDVTVKPTSTILSRAQRLAATLQPAPAPSRVCVCAATDQTFKPHASAGAERKGAQLTNVAGLAGAAAGCGWWWCGWRATAGRRRRATRGCGPCASWARSSPASWTPTACPRWEPRKRRDLQPGSSVKGRHAACKIGTSAGLWRQGAESRPGPHHVLRASRKR